MSLLSIDPSSTILGYAVFSNMSLVGVGEIDATKAAYDRRYMHITSELSKLKKRYRITEVACERAVRFQGRRIPALEVAVTAIKKWSERNRLPITFYSPREWKVSAVGDGRADKEAVARILSLEYPQLFGLSEHVADAVGIGLHHLGLKRVEKMIK